MASLEQIQKNRSRLNGIWERYRLAMDQGHKDYTFRAKYLEQMYLGAGQQWAKTPEIVEALETAGKPVLELNLIGADIRRLKGYQTQSRMNISYEPRGEGDEKISEILSKIALFELDQNRFPWLESQVFEDGIVQQRGYFDIRMDYETDLRGKIKITTLDPLDVIPDPNGKTYDPDGWEEVTVNKWIPLETIKALYPSKYKEVKLSMSSSEDDWGHFNDEGAERNTFSQPYTTFNYLKISEEDYYVRVLDKQYKETTRRDFYYDLENDNLIPVPDDLTKRQAKAEAKRMGYEIVPRIVKRIKWVVCTRDVILHEDWSPYEHFTIVPFFPIFRRGQTQGLVDNLISNQEVINKAHSQLLHIINTTANSGWITQEGSLVNMDDEDLEQEGASTGLHIVYRRGYEKPEKIQPNQIPTGLRDFLNLSIGIHDRLLGVSEAFRGDRSNEVSGIALQERVNQTAVGLSSIIDNLMLTRNILARLMLNLIQNFYTEERTFRIVVDKQTGETEELTVNQPAEVETGQEEPDVGIINDITVGKYDVVISDIPTTVNYQQGQLAEALEFRKFGVQIPDDEMVRMSSLARKKEIADRLKGDPTPEQQQQMQAQIEQLIAEVAKTKAEAENKEQDTISKAAEVAKMIAENPAIAPVLQQIMALNPPEAVVRQNEVQRQQEQQMLGQY